MEMAHSMLRSVASSEALANGNRVLVEKDCDFESIQNTLQQYLGSLEPGNILPLNQPGLSLDNILDKHAKLVVNGKVLNNYKRSTLLKALKSAETTDFIFNYLNSEGLFGLSQIISKEYLSECSTEKYKIHYEFSTTAKLGCRFDVVYSLNVKSAENKDYVVSFKISFILAEATTNNKDYLLLPKQLVSDKILGIKVDAFAISMYENISKNFWTNASARTSQVKLILSIAIGLFIAVGATLATLTLVFPAAASLLAIAALPLAAKCAVLTADTAAIVTTGCLVGANAYSLFKAKKAEPKFDKATKALKLTQVNKPAEPASHESIKSAEAQGPSLVPLW